MQALANFEREDFVTKQNLRDFAVSTSTRGGSMKRTLTATLALLLASLGLPMAVAQDYKDEVRSYPPDLTETFRPALPQDFYPGGEPALGPLAGAISIFDVVVSNTNANLKNTNTTANSEPSIAIDPANTNKITILAFSGGWGATAPIWYSSNGGSLWTLDHTIPNPPGLSQNCPCDQNPDYGLSGRLSATFLHNDTAGKDVYSSNTWDPTIESDWLWFVSGGVTQTTNQQGIGNPDQPWLLVNKDPKNPTNSNVYAAYDNFDGAPDMRVAVAPGNPPDFTTDKLVGYSAPGTNPGLRLAKDLNSLAMYAMWQQCVSNCGGDPKTIAFYLNRSTDGGKTWSLNGSSTGLLLVETQSTQPTPKFGTVNALLGGIDHLAVDPNNGDVYVVYGNKDTSTRIDRLSIAHLTANGSGGLKWLNNYFVVGQAETALPSVAIAKNTKGTIGVLYTNFDGIDLTTKLPQFSVFLALSDDHGKSFTYNRLEKFLSTTKDNGNARQRVLGDYQQLKAVGNTFYGVFSGNGVPFGRPFANIDPIFFKTTVSD
jgi:hypothetical protein